ncbi:peptidoglycan-binding protein LysM, partial [Acinetobacter baumannii]
MGLFDFVKGIGKKNTAPAEPQAAPAAPAEPSAQEIANKLLGLIKSLGLGVEGLSV